MRFIVENLQVLTIALAGLAVLVSPIFGLKRVQIDDEESSVTFNKRKALRPLSVALVGLLAATVVSFTPRGYDGVVFSASEGVLEDELRDGLHFRLPGSVVMNVNTQVQVYRHNNESVFQHTLDTQEIRVPVAVNYRAGNASYVYEELAGGPATIIEPAVLRALRTVIGQYSLEQIAANQSVINSQIEDAIRPQLESHGLIIDFVAIEDTIGKTGIMEAIEQERIAERNKITAAHNREIAAIDADAVIETARGQAESIVRVADAERQRLNDLGMTPTEFIWYVRDNLVLPQVFTGSGTDFILPIPELGAPASE